MISTATPPGSTAKTIDLRASAIALAEERLAALRRLAALGMRLAEEVCERAISSPYSPEPTHEPARAFATVSRAVRLTLVLQARIETSLFALCAGGPVVVADPAGHRAGRAAAAKVTPDEDADDSALDALDSATESLCEHERFDEVLGRPFDDCVAAIRSDLGLGANEEAPLLGADDASPCTKIEETRSVTSQTGDLTSARREGTIAATAVEATRLQVGGRSHNDTG